MHTPGKVRACWAAAAWALALPCAQAQPDPGWQWGVSAAFNRYAERDMSLAGPQWGVQAEWFQPLGLDHWTLQAQVQAGAPDYNSPVSGRIDGRRVVQTAWHARYGWPGPAPWGLTGRLESGLALHTHYNDLRGTTSAGHLGYERERFGLWATAGYSTPAVDLAPLGAQDFRVEVALLLQGAAVSHLSQVSSVYADARNRQRSGWSVRSELGWRLDTGSWRPYLQFTRLGASEPRTLGTLKVVEPANTTWEFGLQWFWR